MKRPQVSVIVPVYNVEKEVSKCLLSLILQKFEDYEIIIVDDGSTDNSNDVCEKIKSRSDKIRLFKTKNNGLSAARNFGIGKAKGSYIVFVDSDDYVDPDFLFKLHRSIISNNADIAICGYTEFFKNKMKNVTTRDTSLSRKDALIRLLTKQENLDVVAWNKIYKRDLFDKISFPEGFIFEDTLTTYKIFNCSNKINYISSPLYNYVRRSNSIMSEANTILRLKTKVSAAKNAIKLFSKDAELFEASNYSLLLSYLQFIDFSVRKEISIEYFYKYKKLILDKKNYFLKNDFMDTKRRLYIILLSFWDGRLYRILRNII